MWDSPSFLNLSLNLIFNPPVVIISFGYMNAYVLMWCLFMFMHMILGRKFPI